MLDSLACLGFHMNQVTVFPSLPGTIHTYAGHSAIIINIPSFPVRIIPL